MYSVMIRKYVNHGSILLTYGYSHLSGTDTTSLLLRCVHSQFRPLRRASGGVGWPLSPRSHSEYVSLHVALAIEYKPFIGLH